MMAALSLQYQVLFAVILSTRPVVIIMLLAISDWQKWILKTILLINVVLLNAVKMIKMPAGFAQAAQIGELDSESPHMEKILGRKPAQVNDFLKQIYCRKEII